MTEQTEASRSIAVSGAAKSEPDIQLVPVHPGDFTIDLAPVKYAVIGAILIFTFISVKFSPLVAAKIIVFLFFMALALVCFGIFFIHRLLLVKLMELEHMGNQIRDDALAQIVAGRDGLEKLNQRLSGGNSNHDDGSSSVPELLKAISPLLMFAMQKEKSLIRWGMTGLKVARTIQGFFKGK
jgi:hypothetical protein